jgi:ech hydrogenase subunit A
MGLLEPLLKTSPLTLAAVLVLSPALFGLVVFGVRTKWSRKGVVTVAGWVLTLAAAAVFAIAFVGRAALTATLPADAAPWSLLVAGGDLALLAAILVIAVRFRSVKVLLAALVQLAVVLYAEFAGGHAAEAAPAVFIDWLSVVMVMIVSVIGSIIVVYGLPYMKEHERHLGIDEAGSHRPGFFLTMLVFLGAMNGLVIFDDLRWVFFFWEVTTLCSFLLIRHDATELANTNALRALWMNTLGGVGFAVAIALFGAHAQTYSVQALLRSPMGAAASVPIVAALACLMFAAFTKSAQMPFHSWLLGAMVAPTPVSALLHSSTMVKAGVYLLMRFAPAFHGTQLSNVLAIAGGFTFVATAFLAIGQTNAKKILAYSTISNLGLIIACTGLNRPLALAAAVMLLIFHALSKGLLFMACGVVEHGIHSRDIEDMQGLVNRMPLTTLIMVIGILSMLLPPFGVLIAKLAAIEASVHLPLAMGMLVIGSTLTVAFWTKWTGRLLTSEPGAVHPKIEHLHVMYFVPLVLLTVGAVAFSLAVFPLLTELVEPAVTQYYALVPGAAGGVDLSSDVLAVPWGLVFGFMAIAVAVPALLARTRPDEEVGAYMCGEQIETPNGSGFITAAEQSCALSIRGHYFERYVGEETHALWMTVVAALLLAGMFGAVAIR